MALKIWRFVTLLLAALALGLTSAHVLQLPQKMDYDAPLYAAVNTTLFRYYASVGAFYSIGALAASVVLAVLVRRRPRAFRWTLAGAVFFLLWLASWLALVAPVNHRIAAALRSAPQTVASLWMAWRPRWEYGHAAGFVLMLFGFAALLISVLSEPAAVRRGGGG
jgi:hypothetical protein